MLNLKRVEQVLLFLTILFLPTQLGKHFWPEFSFVYSLPIDYLSPTLYFWDLLAVLLCIVFLVQGGHINRVALNLFFLFLLTQSFSLFSNPLNIGIGLVRLEQYLIAGLFGVYLASSKSSRTTSVIFWGFILSITSESFLAIAQFLKGGTVGFWLLGERNFSLSTPAISKFDFYGREFLRPYATFPHPNVLAGFMLVGVMLLSSVRNLLKRAAAIFAAVVILLTMSRVVIIAGLVFAFTTQIKNSSRVLLLFFLIILLPILYTRFSSLLNFDNLTFIRREELSFIAVKIWTTSPIFGLGLNNFIPAAADLLLSGPSRFLQPVHNIFLLSLSETGMVGLVGLIVLTGYPIFMLSKLSPKQYPVLFVWGVIIFLGMFDHYFLTLPQGYRLLFFIWGLNLRMLR